MLVSSPSWPCWCWRRWWWCQPRSRAVLGKQKQSPPHKRTRFPSLPLRSESMWSHIKILPCHFIPNINANHDIMSYSCVMNHVSHANAIPLWVPSWIFCDNGDRNPLHSSLPGSALILKPGRKIYSRLASCAEIPSDVPHSIYIMSATLTLDLTDSPTPFSFSSPHLKISS